MIAKYFIELHGEKILQPKEWESLIGIIIYDPDGWDRKNCEVDFAKPLSLKEFLNKAAYSTTKTSKLFMELYKSEWFVTR